MSDSILIVKFLISIILVGGRWDFEFRKVDSLYISSFLLHGAFCYLYTMELHRARYWLPASGLFVYLYVVCLERHFPSYVTQWWGGGQANIHWSWNLRWISSLNTGIQKAAPESRQWIIWRFLLLWNADQWTYISFYWNYGRGRYLIKNCQSCLFFFLEIHR